MVVVFGHVFSSDATRRGLSNAEIHDSLKKHIVFALDDDFFLLWHNMCWTFFHSFSHSLHFRCPLNRPKQSSLYNERSLALDLLHIFQLLSLLHVMIGLCTEAGLLVVYNQHHFTHFWFEIQLWTLLCYTMMLSCGAPPYLSVCTFLSVILPI